MRAQIDVIRERFLGDFPWLTVMGTLLIFQSILQNDFQTAQNGNLDPAIYFITPVLTMLYGNSRILTNAAIAGGVLRLFGDPVLQTSGFLLQGSAFILAVKNYFAQHP